MSHLPAQVSVEPPLQVHGVLAPYHRLVGIAEGNPLPVDSHFGSGDVKDHSLVASLVKAGSP